MHRIKTTQTSTSNSTQSGYSGFRSVGGKGGPATSVKQLNAKSNYIIFTEI